MFQVKVCFFVLMNSIPYKAKQFLLVLVKLLIVGSAIYYLYAELSKKNLNDWQLVSTKFTFFSLVGIVFLSVLNWFFEILKWQNLVNTFYKISLKEATVQSLGSLTASIFTPNRVGEYGAKMLYFPKSETKKIILLNFISNSSQMATTLFFGVVGLMITGLFYDYFSYKIALFLFIILLLFSLFIIFGKKIIIYGFSVEKLIQKIKSFPRNSLKTTQQLSVIRFLIFSHQFYFLLVIFGVEITYSLALATIFSMYFLASIVPSIHLMDVAIKGSVAFILFGKLGVNQWTIVSITTLMWFLNLVIPVLIGSLFVLKFKPKLEL
ncbi:lysylphosphatidylglycerol synthase domain-containing protein [Flavobacterium lacus]|uniref:Lysylphosphatidylglycerol synthase-like protein n=1 Tax=Flavobacterium lacus TaxID=1353778 RepID=A0A328WVD8_9FLAO|nr:lysylphosphatidylglycerol synthase-like protein [Flavobacterium lacus]